MNELLKIFVYFPNDTVIKRKDGNYNDYHYNRINKKHIMRHNINSSVELHNGIFKTALPESDIDVLAKFLSFNSLTFSITRTKILIKKVTTSDNGRVIFYNFKLVYKDSDICFIDYMLNKNSKILTSPTIIFKNKPPILFIKRFSEEIIDNIEIEMANK